MKKIIALPLTICLVGSLFYGCKKDPDPVSKVVQVTYPTIVLVGPEYVHIPIGGTYADPGATLTDDITGAVSHVTPTSSDLDASTQGLYKISYIAANANGFKTTVVRTVLVLDYTPPVGLDPNFDISGDYLRAATGVICKVTKVENGLYITDHIGGSTAVPAYFVTPNETSFDIPPQNSYDGFPVDGNGEVFVAGPPITLKYHVAAEGFGTQLRTFVKQ